MLPPMPDPNQPAAPRSVAHDAADAGGPPAPVLLLLAALFPGLPHLVRGRRGWAALLALPVLLAIAALVAATLLTGAVSTAARLLDPAVLGALLVVQVALLAWRLLGIAAVRVLTPLRPRAGTIAAALLSVALVVGPQVLAAQLTADARDAAAEVFAPALEGGEWVPSASAPPVASNDPDFAAGATPSSSPGATASPSASPTPAVARVNVLLIGVDAGVGRSTFLTDSMIVASLDPVAGTVSMASIARDTVDVPLPDGRLFRQKINSLVAYASMHPDKFPGARDGQSVLAAALGTLLGIRIDLWAQVTLGGFVRVVDSVGGVNIKVTSAFCDYRYKEYGISGFAISPGWWHMNGDQALAYARVRKAAGQSDFTRAARQQELIAALRDRLVQGGFLEDPGAFLRSLGQTVSTNIPPSFIAQWIEAAGRVGRADVFRVVVDHPYVKPGYDARGSIQIPDLAAIRALSASLFPPPGTRPVGFDTMPAAGTGATRNAGSSASCGVSPKPKPTQRPTAGPTGSPTQGAAESGPGSTPAEPTPAGPTPAAPTPAEPTPVDTAP